MKYIYIPIEMTIGLRLKSGTEYPTRIRSEMDRFGPVSDLSDLTVGQRYEYLRVSSRVRFISGTARVIRLIRYLVQDHES